MTTNFPLEGYAVSADGQEDTRTVAAFDRALAAAQQIADTDRAAVEAAVEKFLGILQDHEHDRLSRSVALVRLPSKQSVLFLGP